MFEQTYTAFYHHYRFCVLFAASSSPRLTSEISEYRHQNTVMWSSSSTGYTSSTISNDGVRAVHPDHDHLEWKLYLEQLLDRDMFPFHQRAFGSRSLRSFLSIPLIFFAGFPLPGSEAVQISSSFSSTQSCQPAKLSWTREHGDPPSFGILVINANDQSEFGQAIPIPQGDSSGEIEVQFPKAGQFLVKGVFLPVEQRPEQISPGHQISVTGSDTCGFAGSIVQSAVQPTVSPTVQPTVQPTTVSPTVRPTVRPTINNPSASTLIITRVNTVSPLPNNSASSTTDVPPTDTTSTSRIAPPGSPPISNLPATGDHNTSSSTGDGGSSTPDANTASPIPPTMSSTSPGNGPSNTTPSPPFIPSTFSTSPASASPLTTTTSTWSHSDARSRLNERNGIILGIIGGIFLVILLLMIYCRRQRLARRRKIEDWRERLFGENREPLPVRRRPSWRLLNLKRQFPGGREDRSSGSTNSNGHWIVDSRPVSVIRPEVMRM
ncbi:hypothetical protein Moror_2467 [Moniliophthora roreri MCA 2997]|uniref:Uncharacterized protein n=1 Tax=Moniliophthora roreri (strain MCA 2997) TaxID=1381753 RepID=V2WFZ9_MONRO|nr:hypothetical protein Moror_2467 [Moniliophthora roreri MCA 2997]